MDLKRLWSGFWRISRRPAYKAALRGLDWDEVRATGSKVDAVAFLSRYPNGAFAEQIYALQALDAGERLLVTFP